MTRLRSATIRDFLRLESLDLTFPDAGAILLCGDNGTGKTSALEALAVALGCQRPATARPASSLVRAGASDFRVEIVANVEGSIEQVVCDGAAVDACPGRDAAPHTAVAYLPDDRDSAGCAVKTRGGGRRGFRGVHTMSSPAAFVLGGDLGGDELRLLRFVRRFLGPQVRLNVADDVDGLRVTLCDEAGPAPGRPGGGAAAILRLGGAAVLYDPDVVLIDEPEQHLHAQWQRHIMPALAELAPRALFVVATHSAEIMASATSSERVFLR